MADKMKIYAYLGPTYNENIEPFSLKDGINHENRDHKNFMNGVPVTYDFKPIYFDHTDFEEK